jgi:hypothetical protein
VCFHPAERRHTERGKPLLQRPQIVTPNRKVVNQVESAGASVWIHGIERAAMVPPGRYDVMAQGSQFLEVTIDHARSPVHRKQITRQVPVRRDGGMTAADPGVGHGPLRRQREFPPHPREIMQPIAFRRGIPPRATPDLTPARVHPRALAAVTIGVIVSLIVWLIPVVGVLLLLTASTMGVGALVTRSWQARPRRGLGAAV